MNYPGEEVGGEKNLLRMVEWQMVYILRSQYKVCISRKAANEI